MRHVPTVLLLGLLLGVAAGGLRALAEDRDAKEDPASQKLRAEQEAAREKLTTRLFALLEQYGETLRGAREVESTRCKVLARNLQRVQAALVEARGEAGSDQPGLPQQLAKEQQRHVGDVTLLQQELARANEAAEANRIQATWTLQELDVARKERDRLRGWLVQGIRLVGDPASARADARSWLEGLAAGPDPVLAKAAQAAREKLGGK